MQGASTAGKESSLGFCVDGRSETTATAEKQAELNTRYFEIRILAICDPCPSCAVTQRFIGTPHETDKSLGVSIVDLDAV
jgi:hypothetical protein